MSSPSAGAASSAALAGARSRPKRKRADAVSVVEATLGGEEEKEEEGGRSAKGTPASAAASSSAAAGAPAALPVDSAGDATALLPYTYQHLLAFFPRVYALACLYWHRGTGPCTYAGLQASLGPLFTFVHLRQVVALAPGLLRLEPTMVDREEEDPFAPKSTPVHMLPTEAAYELLSPDLLAAAAKKAHGGPTPARSANEKASSSSQSRIHGFRNDISRPRGLKPTPSMISAALATFKRCVVEHFARPDATIQPPVCPLKPIHPPTEEEEGAASSVTLSVPSYSKLLDALTVTAQQNTDAVTRPRAAWRAHSSPDEARPPREATIDIMDVDSDVEIIEHPTSTAAAGTPTAVKRETSAAVASSAAALSSGGASPSPASPLVASFDADSDRLEYIESPLLPNLIAHLRQQKFFRGQITYVHHTPPRHAITGEIRPKSHMQRQQPQPNGASSTAAAAAAAAASGAASTAAATDASSAAAASSPIIASSSAVASSLGLGADAPVYLSPAIHTALLRHTPPISRLFLHQSQAINALLVDKAPVVVVATPTSSGKSFCYSIPLVETLSSDRQARAIAMFPTKALAQDQLRSLREFVQTIGGASITVDTYDGDTPAAVRPSVRESTRVLLTNPDMLHQSILPRHHEFAATLKHLRYVILDETHVYRGLFGSHVCLILRRLRRLCAYYGSAPQFIFCSATIGNARAFVGTLCGVDQERIVVVDEDGSARGEKAFCLWNPPIITNTLTSTAAADGSSDERRTPRDSKKRYEYSHYLALQSTSRRRSTFMESALLLANLVQINYRTICFAGTRKVVEMVTDWTRQVLSQATTTAPLIPLVKSYRGGYSAADRRQIEREMFAGHLRGIVSTNALELGIDIGSLDCTMHIGLPPTMANLLQQSGRSGRGARPSLSILLAHDTPLDQFYLQHPQQLFARKPERCIVDYESPYLMRLHLMCAAMELPLQPHTDGALFGARFPEVFDTLVHEKMYLAQRPIDPNQPSPFDAHPAYDLLSGTWEAEFTAQSPAGGQRARMRLDQGPADCFSIRTPTGKVYQIVDANGALVDETEERRAMFDLHEGAVYSNQGREYLVQSVDRSRQVIRLQQVHGQRYYTKCIDHKHSIVLSRMQAFSTAATAAAERMDDQENKEQERAPPSISQTLTNMHAALTSSSPQAGTSAAASSAGSFSLLPYAPLQSWYIKPETPLAWLDLCSYGRIKVTTSVYGYRKVSKLTSRVLDRLPLTMPVHEFETWAAWVDVPRSIQMAYAEWAKKQPPTRNGLRADSERNEDDAEEEQKANFHSKSNTRAAAAAASAGPSSNKRVKLESCAVAAAAAAAASPGVVAHGDGGEQDACDRPIHAGLHGLNHCLIGLMPMYLLCDGADDLRCDCPSVYEASYEQRTPRAHRLLLYEKVPSAGPAFMRETARVLHRVLAHARQVIASCPCTGAQGCPSCIQSSRCSELNEVSDKAAALWLATTLEEWSREYPIPA